MGPGWASGTSGSPGDRDPAGILEPAWVASRFCRFPLAYTFNDIPHSSCRPRRPSPATVATGSPAAIVRHTGSRCGIRMSLGDGRELPSAPRSCTPSFRGQQRLPIEDTWDVLGIRATRSEDTCSKACSRAERYVGRGSAGGCGGRPLRARAVRVGPARFVNIYYWLSRRAYERRSTPSDSDAAIGLSRRWPITQLQPTVAEIRWPSIRSTALERGANHWSRRNHGAGGRMRSSAHVHGGLSIVVRCRDLALLPEATAARHLTAERPGADLPGRRALGPIHPSNAMLTTNHRQTMPASARREAPRGGIIPRGIHHF